MERMNINMFNVYVYATPFATILLLLSLSAWLSICKWGFRYDMRDREMACVRHANRFLSRTVFVKDGDVDQSCRILNRILNKEGILQQYRQTRTFELPCHTRRRINFERCKAYYTEDMQRKIKFLLRTNRKEIYPGSA